jgi:hypothetical protein
MVSLEAGGETDAVAFGSSAPAAGATVEDEATSECSISVWVALSRKGVVILVSPVTPAAAAVEVVRSEASWRGAPTRAFSMALGCAEVVATRSTLSAIGSIGVDLARRSAADFAAPLRVAPALALVGALAAAGTAVRAAADFDAPERAALALAAVLAAARVLAEALPVAALAVLAGLLAEDLAAVALLARVRAAEPAGVLPAAARVEADRPPADFEARPVAVALAAPAAAFPVLLAPAVAFLVRVSAEEALSPPFVAPRPTADALRFFPVFLLDEGIRGYSFYCPAVETGREAS